MKYVLILTFFVFLIRIDFWLGLVEKGMSNFTRSREVSVEIDPSDIKATREVVTVANDPSFKQTPRKTFLALLEDFHTNPIIEIRDRALVIFKEHPTIFTQKLDKELEAHIFSWRDLLNNNDPEAVSFMLDLLNILQGENLEMMKRFFALWMDINMEHFIAAYSKSKDVNCMIGKTYGDIIPEEEKLNEYYEREDALKLIVAKEKIEPAQKALATNCLMVIGIEISKIAPKPLPEEQPPVIDPTISIDTAQGGVTP